LDDVNIRSAARLLVSTPDAAQVSPLDSVGLGIVIALLGVMLVGVAWRQWRGSGPAVFRNPVVRAVFGQEYGPRWLRSTPTPWFDQGMRLFVGTAFVIVGVLAIVIGIARL
jgi:hypothetical protein